MQPDRRPPTGPEPQAASSPARDKATLELVFISITGVLVLCAFGAALTYDTVSAIGPFCIMIPLLILIAVQFRRTLRASRADKVRADLAQVVTGGNRVFNAAAIFVGWMAVLVGLIFVAGHYVGIALFMFVLLRWISGERALLSAAISAGATLLIYLLFEFGFKIEMYRGIIDRWL